MELLSCGVNVDLQSFQLASDANLAMMDLGRNPKSYYKRSDEGAGQKMELDGTVLRMPEHRLVRQVLLNCVNPTHETLFADVPNLSIENATKNVCSVM